MVSAMGGYPFFRVPVTAATAESASLRINRFFNFAHQFVTGTANRVLTLYICCSKMEPTPTPATKAKPV
jgi:hypothetical protein